MPCAPTCGRWPTLASPRREHIVDRKTFMEAELEASSQSRVGEKLTELTIRKVRAGSNRGPARRRCGLRACAALMPNNSHCMQLLTRGLDGLFVQVLLLLSPHSQSPPLPTPCQVIIMVLLVMFAMPVFDVSGEQAWLWLYGSVRKSNAVTWAGDVVAQRATISPEERRSQRSWLQVEARALSISGQRGAAAANHRSHAAPHSAATVGYYGGAPLLDNGGLDLLHIMYNGTRNPADPTFLAATNVGQNLSGQCVQRWCSCTARSACGAAICLGVRLQLPVGSCFWRSRRAATWKRRQAWAEAGARD